LGKDKLKRFEEIKSFPNVLEPPVMETYEKKGKWHKEVFKNDNPIVLELGCGKGEYSVGLAKLYPNKNFVGIDIKGNRIYIGAKQCIEQDISNVMFLRTRIDFINNFFDTDEIDEIWLTFSDPQPKKPRKRLSSKLFIDRYRKFLKKNGKIHVKTDSDLLYNYTLDEIKENKYKLIECSENVYEELISRVDDQLIETMKIQTFYESIWLKENKTIKYLAFSI